MGKHLRVACGLADPAIKTLVALHANVPTKMKLEEEEDAMG